MGSDGQDWGLEAPDRDPCLHGSTVCGKRADPTKSEGSPGWEAPLTNAARRITPPGARTAAGLSRSGMPEVIAWSIEMVTGADPSERPSDRRVSRSSSDTEELGAVVPTIR